MKILEELKYTKDHEWVKLEGETAVIGISDYAQHELGDIVFVDVATVGETLEKDETFGSIEAVKTVSDLYLPLGGEILEFNEELENNPSLINTNPYDKGWIIKIKIADIGEIDDLLDATAYKDLLGL